MPSSRFWVIMDVSLALVVLILAFNLVGLKLPSFGLALNLLEKGEAHCAASWKGEVNIVKDLDLCCFEALQQLSCTKMALPDANLLGNQNTFDWHCQTGSGKVLQFYLNNKAYRYCRSLWR